MLIIIVCLLMIDGARDRERERGDNLRLRGRGVASEAAAARKVAVTDLRER